MRTDDITKHRKKRPTKKPYAIEWRCIGGNWWFAHSEYPTQTQMEQSFLQLSRSIFFEYRIKP